jgi:hypothetical protein
MGKDQPIRSGVIDVNEIFKLNCNTHRRCIKVDNVFFLCHAGGDRHPECEKQAFDRNIYLLDAGSPSSVAVATTAVDLASVAVPCYCVGLARSGMTNELVKSTLMQRLCPQPLSHEERGDVNKIFQISCNTNRRCIKVMYVFYVMPVETGIQNAKGEHSDRKFHMLDAGFPMISYRDYGWRSPA